VIVFFIVIRPTTSKAALVLNLCSPQRNLDEAQFVPAGLAHYRSESFKRSPPVSTQVSFCFSVFFLGLRTIRTEFRKTVKGSLLLNETKATFFWHIPCS
jgi:hypothetical protein